MTYRRFHHSRCSKVVTNVLPVIHMSGSHLPMTLGLLLPRGKAHVAGRSLAPAPSFVTPSTHHRPCRSIPPLAHCRLLKPLGASLPCARRRAHPARALPPPQHTHTPHRQEAAPLRGATFGHGRMLQKGPLEIMYFLYNL